MPRNELELSFFSFNEDTRLFFGRNDVLNDVFINESICHRRSNGVSVRSMTTDAYISYYIVPIFCSSRLACTILLKTLWRWRNERV